MDKSIGLKAYAKLNLSLDVAGVLADGYHRLDMLVCSVGLFDRVNIALDRAEGIEVVMTRDGKICDMAKEENTAYRAAVSFCDEFGNRGMRIEIEKGIPEGAGLGGSSADAAAVLAGLARLFGVPSDDARLYDIALSVGSDVPYMLSGGFASVKGRGEEIVRLGDTPKFHLVIVFSGSNSTGKVYAEYDRMSAEGELSFERISSESLFDMIRKGDTEEFLRRTQNALTQPAVRINAEIGKSLAFLSGISGRRAIMTGSGSGVFVICPTADAAERIADLAIAEGKTAVATKTVSRGIEEI